MGISEQQGAQGGKESPSMDAAVGLEVGEGWNKRSENRVMDLG